MSIDHSDEVGWPSKGTPVRTETERIFPAPMFAAEREKRDERVRNWRLGDGREKWLANQSKWNKLRA